ncbi:MAG: Flagellar biosynthesis protein FliR [Myxococcaceae bacterium]|nr:Flagellar biosynthesis protein FliR [Myxococcaceae bacterium]
MPSSSAALLTEIARAFADAGIDLASVGLAWARVAPTVAIVPAFGLKALPAPARGVIAVALGVSIFPALTGVVVAHAAEPWPLLALEEILRGLPIALGAAIPLWAATMAGGLVDTLRGAQDQTSFATVEGRVSTLGVPFALLASAIFLSTGGPARVVTELASRELAPHPVLAAANDLVHGIGLAVAIGAPLLAAALVLEIAGALVARAASPAQVHLLIAPLRALGLLAVIGIVLDRIAAVLALAIAG